MGFGSWSPWESWRVVVRVLEVLPRGVCVFIGNCKFVGFFPTPYPNLQDLNIGSFIIRIGFWGILYYNYDKEPPQKTLFKIIRPLQCIT